MKVINPVLVLSAFLFFIVNTAVAQETKTSAETGNEISVSVGVLTIQELATSLGDAFATSLTAQKVEKSTGTGAITVAYNRFASEKFSYGLSGTWEKLSATYSNPDDKIDWNVLIITANCKYYYVAKPAFRFYSGIGAGYAGFKAKSNNSNFSNGTFAFQVNAIGLRFGKSFGAFAELGFGYEGLIKAGLSLRF